MHQLTEEPSLKKITYSHKEDLFFTTLRQRVNDYFKGNGLNKQDDSRMYLKTAVQLVLWITIYGCILSGYFLGWALFFLQIAFHFTMFLMSVGIAHDGSHGAYSSRKWVNRMMYCMFDVIGINSHMWEYNHNLSHHYVPNIPRYDSAIDSFGLFRFHPRAKYYRFHRYQHFYIVFIYSLSTLFKILFLDFFSFFRNRIGLIRIERHKLKDILYLVFTKLVVIFYMLILPILVIDAPAWQVIAGFIAGNLVGGIALGVIFQVTHLSDYTVFVEPDQEGVIPTTFPMHIMRTTSDFATGNKIVTWISGGLNIHVAHHLFPKISQVHLPAIAKILKETAFEFNVPYKEYPTVLAAIKSHLRLLKKLGSKEMFLITDWPVTDKLQ
ncbi:MAG: acyl-CoA desaturase [Chitinophagaceae bacterium]